MMITWCKVYLACSFFLLSLMLFCEKKGASCLWIRMEEYSIDFDFTK